MGKILVKHILRSLPRGGEDSGACPEGRAAHRSSDFKESRRLHLPVPRKAAVPHLEISAAAAAKSLQSCPTLCGPIDGNPPGSAVPRILQARILDSHIHT